MESSKLSVKFYLDESSAKPNLADIVPLFHSWIQLHLIQDHVLIDVADYAHVADGPGVALIAHEANIYLDNFDGRTGLTYQRKTPLDGSFGQRLAAVFRAALEACHLLETNPSVPGIKFRTNEVDFKINDRFYAPNTPQTLGTVKPQIEKFAKELLGGTVTLEHRDDPKRLFELFIRTTNSSDIGTLLTRLETLQPA
jgi:hypothetical protein